MNKNLKKYCLVLISLVLLVGVFPSASYSFDVQSAAFSLDAEARDINSITEIQKIEKLLDDYEASWNKHEMETIENYYADIFINGDGLNLEQVKKLTEELWEAYPNIETRSKERDIRVYGDYATVNSTDVYQGNSKTERGDVGTKGTLKAVSIGEVFLKRYGPVWKITSDRTIFERVSIGYGIGNDIIDENKVLLSAPEQVVSGQNYTANLSFDLPSEIKPIAAITKEVLIYPQVSTDDKFRLVDRRDLERLFSSNKISRNELISSTIGLTGGPLQPKLLGLIFLTRRVNVIPISNEVAEAEITSESAKSALSKLDYIEFDLEKTAPIKDEKPKKNKKEKDIKVK